MARLAGRNLRRQGDAQRALFAAAGSRVGEVVVRHVRSPGKRRGSAARRARRFRAGRAGRGEAPRGDPEPPAPGRPHPARLEPDRRPGAVPARDVDVGQPRPCVLRRHEALPRSVRVPLEAAGHPRAGRLRGGPVRRHAGELDDRRLREAGQPRVPGGLQRQPRELPRHRERRGSERARSLRRRREDRGLDRRQLEAAPWLGRPRARQGPGQQPRLHGLRAQHLGLGRGARAHQAVERVPRLQDQSHRPGHRRLRRDRLGPRLGRPLPVHDGRPRRGPEPVRGRDVGQPRPVRERVRDLRSAALGVPCEGTAAGDGGEPVRGLGAGGDARARPGTSSSSSA